MERSSTKEQLVRKQFAYWHTEPEGGYWCLFDTLEDAVNEGGEGTEIYALEPTRLGAFKRKVELVKIKTRKRRTKK